MLAAVYPTLQSAVLLCIDDNEDVLECEKSFLESFGYSVLTAAGGGKGLELASEHSVDVVILDYFMPEMNGQEAAIEMRRLRNIDTEFWFLTPTRSRRRGHRRVIWESCTWRQTGFTREPRLRSRTKCVGR
jgi:CheY-like chemotaxis protein